MTSVIDASPEAQESTNEEATVTDSAKRGRERDRDFTKVSQRHEELAAFINAHSGLDPISANVVKAVQLLSVDYTNTDEAKASREAAKAARKEAEKQYAGLSDDEKKEIRAAERKMARLSELEARRQELLDKAKAAQESGEVPDESDSEAESVSGEVEPGKRGIRRRR